MLAVLLAVSILEGLWVWLLAATVSEFDGQIAPSLPFACLVIFGSWLAGRLLFLSPVSPAARRWTLVGGGLGLALLVTVVHAGLVVPLQLILGRPDPDYRGSAVVFGFLVAYLWARGLALAGQLTRRQVVSHVLVSTFVLVNILLVLPLSDHVRADGLGVVVGSFFAALTALLLVQTADTESHQVSRKQWVGLAMGAALLMVLCGAMFTGMLAQGMPGVVGDSVRGIASLATPVTNVIILGIGYAAHYLTLFMIFLRTLYGTDPETTQRSQEEAERNRFRLENEANYGPPELMTLFAAVVFFAILAWFIARVLARLVHLGETRSRGGTRQTRTSLRDHDLMDGLRDALGRLPGLGGLADGLGGRGAEIRRQYRAFQALMARAQMPRRSTQTTTEYQEELARRVPQAATPIAQISNAYVLARYAGPETPLPDAGSLAEALREIHSVLQADELGRTAR